MAKNLKFKPKTLDAVPPTGSKSLTNKEMLIALVEKTISESPRERDGFQWAERSIPEWAQLIGVSVATIGRLISEEPFVRDLAHMSDGSKKKVTLLRIGDGSPVKKTPRHLANIMSKIFKKVTGRNPDSRGYGCLIGCAETWPDGHQIEIFKLVMDEWNVFMVGLRLYIDVGDIVPPVEKNYEKPIKYLKWKYPHLPTLRLGAPVALELYVSRMQEKQANKLLHAYSMQ